MGVIQEAASQSHPAVERRPGWLHRETTPALIAALVTVVLWASAFVGIRSAGKALSPGPLTLGRLLVGTVVLAVIAAARRERVPSLERVRSVGPALLGCALLWFGAYNIALNAAERHVDAGTAAMLVNVGPILIAVLAGFALREGFPRSLLVGCAIAFAGVVVIGLATSNGGSTSTGVVLCVLAAFAYAGGVVLQKLVLGRLSALQTTFLCCLITTVACLPFAPQLVREVRGADAGSIGWIVYLGAFPTAIAFTTWAFALSRTTAGKLGATTYLVSPLSILFGWLLLSESPPRLAFLGGALALAGVAVVRRG